VNELDDEPRRPRPRRSFLGRLGHDIGFGSLVSGTDTRAELDALRQYDEEESSGQGLLSKVPGWLLLVLLLALVVYVVVFTGFR
jgi:hypothetical protein